MKVTEAINYFGSAAKLARALGVGPASVTYWKNTGHITYKQQARLEKLTGGALMADKDEFFERIIVPAKPEDLEKYKKPVWER